MYENGIDVAYETTVNPADGVTYTQPGKITLPGWCAGDVPMALALYLHGHRSMVDVDRVIDWQPHEDEPDVYVYCAECDDTHSTSEHGK